MVSCRSIGGLGRWRKGGCGRGRLGSWSKQHLTDAGGKSCQHIGEVKPDDRHERSERKKEEPQPGNADVELAERHLNRAKLPGNRSSNERDADTGEHKNGASRNCAKESDHEKIKNATPGPSVCHAVAAPGECVIGPKIIERASRQGNVEKSMIDSCLRFKQPPDD